MSEIPARPESSERDLGPEIRDLEHQLRQLHQRQRSYRWITGGFVLAILVMVLIFGLSLRRSAERALDREQLSTAAIERLEVIRPQIESNLSAAALDAAPAYRQELSRRLQSALPQLERDFRQRLNQLPIHVEEQLNQKLRASLDRVAQEGVAEAAKTTPALSAGNAPRLAERLRDEMERRGYDLEQHIHALMEQEKQKVETVLLKYETERLASQSADELERRLIDRMLEIAQYEVNNPISVEEPLPPAVPAAIELAPATRPAAHALSQDEEAEVNP